MVCHLFPFAKVGQQYSIEGSHMLSWWRTKNSNGNQYSFRHAYFHIIERIKVSLSTSSSTVQAHDNCCTNGACTAALDKQGGISWNLSSLTICHSLTSTVTFLTLIGYEAPSMTVAMVIVSEWQLSVMTSFMKCPPGQSAQSKCKLKAIV